MSVYDYLTDDQIRLSIIRRSKTIASREDREDFIGEAYRELYDFMEFDRQEINEIIDRVYRKYRPEY